MLLPQPLEPIMSSIQLSCADAVSAVGPSQHPCMHLYMRCTCHAAVAVHVEPLTCASILQVQNLYKSYTVKDSVFKAVQDATLDFPANKIIALLGPSGSGKTTLLRLIAGLESVTDGQIFFGGQRLTHILTRLSKSLPPMRLVRWSTTCSFSCVQLL